MFNKQTIFKLGNSFEFAEPDDEWKFISNTENF